MASAVLPTPAVPDTTAITTVDGGSGSGRGRRQPVELAELAGPPGEARHVARHLGRHRPAGGGRRRRRPAPGRPGRRRLVVEQLAGAPRSAPAPGRPPARRRAGAAPSGTWRTPAPAGPALRTPASSRACPASSSGCGRHRLLERARSPGRRRPRRAWPRRSGSAPSGAPPRSTVTRGCSASSGRSANGGPCQSASASRSGVHGLRRRRRSAPGGGSAAGRSGPPGTPRR